MKDTSKHLSQDIKDAVNRACAVEMAHSQANYEKQVYINELQANIDNLRKAEKGAWWLLPPEDRMRKALESIVLQVIYNDHLDANHILKLCRIALTGVNKENQNGNNTDTVG